MCIHIYIHIYIYIYIYFLRVSRTKLRDFWESPQGIILSRMGESLSGFVVCGLTVPSKQHPRLPHTPPVSVEHVPFLREPWPCEPAAYTHICYQVRIRVPEVTARREPAEGLVTGARSYVSS